MKDKDIKKLLSEQSRRVLPDAKLAENIKAELGIAAERGEERLALANGGEAASSRRRHIVVAAICGLCALVLALCIALPLLLRRSALPPLSLDGNKFADIRDADSFYAYGAASVGSMLSSRGGQSSQAAYAFSATDALAEVRAAADMEKVNGYMALVESLLGQGDITSTSTDGAMDYEYGMTVSYTDFLGDTVQYVMYYDRQLINSGYDEGEKQENYSISGVLVTDDGQYAVSGTYETETEDDESESELWFRAYFSDEDYIEVRQEHENESEDGETEVEKKFTYTVREGGAVERTVVEYELEQDELEVKLSSDGDELTFRSDARGGENVIAVRGRMQGSSVSFTVHVLQGKYRYEFSDGTTQEFDRRVRAEGAKADLKRAY